jgi:hypothetical protein
MSTDEMAEIIASYANNDINFPCRCASTCTHLFHLPGVDLFLNQPCLLVCTLGTTPIESVAMCLSLSNSLSVFGNPVLLGTLLVITSLKA